MQCILAWNTRDNALHFGQNGVSYKAAQGWNNLTFEAMMP